MFGGACGVGPTSLSLLAVAGTPASVVDDARGHAPVPVAAESTAPARRVVRRGVTGRAGRRAVRAGRTVVAVIAAVTTWRGPPPRRGPPLLRA